MDIFNYGMTRTTRDNATGYRLGWLTVYLSYRTEVAFKCGGRLVVCRNVWGQTTGKHLGWVRRQNAALSLVDGVSLEAFQAMLSFVKVLGPNPSEDQRNEALAVMGDAEAASRT